MKVLVTGAAGFIGMHVSERLLARGESVIGLDDLNDYYDVSLKEARLARLRSRPGFDFERADIANEKVLADAFSRARPQRVIHLAAQAGVRNSIRNPKAFVTSNLVGFANVLEACRAIGVEHLVYASSSSVYGGNTHLPFSESDNVDHPVSLYAATKKANELMAHAYSHLYRIPMTGLRFFTVYGPWGRPDMAPQLFADAICKGHPIDVFNNGHMVRDFTYIDDVVESVVRVFDKIPGPDADYDTDSPDPATSNAPFRIFNVGNSHPVALLDFIAALESALGRRADKNMLPMQPGDVAATQADTRTLSDWVGYVPSTALAEGVRRFADWYLGHEALQALNPS